MKRMRSWLWTVGVLGTAFACGALSQWVLANVEQARAGPVADQPKGLRIHRLEILDQDGNSRAVLATTPAGDPFLQLKDRQGKARLELKTHEQAPCLILTPQRGSMGASLVVLNDVPRLVMYDENDELRLGLSVQRGKGPSVVAYGPNLKKLAALGALPMENMQLGSLVIFNQKGEPAAILRCASQTPSLLLYDEAVRTRARFRLGPDGSPELTLLDKQAEPIWTAPSSDE